MTIRPLSATLAFGIVLAAGGAQASTLTGQQFIDTHAGKCITYTGPSKGKQCYGADGSTNYNDQSYGKDTGTWSVRGNEICVTWKKDPGLACGPVSAAGGGKYTDGEYTWTID